MKKTASTLIAGACLALLSNLACADQLADIKQKGVLVCGTLGTAEPFSFPNRADARQWRATTSISARPSPSRLGVKLELKLISVAARIPELQQGRVDVLASPTWAGAPERAEQIAYSDSYYVSLQKVAAKHSEGFKAVSDLAGKRVSAPKGSSTELGLRKASCQPPRRSPSRTAPPHSSPCNRAKSRASRCPR
jgi:polar amino acid transport system substrate-binding protein